MVFGTSEPTWNEVWRVRNVPSSTRLHIRVFVAKSNADAEICDLTLDTYGRTGNEPVVVLDAQKQQISLWVQVSHPVRARCTDERRSLDFGISVEANPIQSMPIRRPDPIPQLFLPTCGLPRIP